MSKTLCIPTLRSYLHTKSKRWNQLSVPVLQHHCIRVANNYLLPSPTLYIAMNTGNFELLNYKPGEIIIEKKNGLSPFNHPHVRLYHEYIKNVWKPPQVLVNIFMPCTRRKPYQHTVTHRMMLHYINDLRNKGIEATLYSISEPMLVVPYRLEKYYPLSNYEFPPELMDRWEKELMVRKLRDLLPRFLKLALLNVFVLPRHHAGIVLSALHNGFCKADYCDQYSNNHRLIDNDIIKVNKAVLLIRYGRLAFRSLRRAYLLILRYFGKQV